MMNKFRFSLFIMFLTAILILSGCVSVVEKRAIEVIDSYEEQVRKHVKSRQAQLDVMLGFLNEDLLSYSYDKEKAEKIRAEIDRVHEEQKFLYTLDFEQFKLDYEVVEKKRNEQDLREMIIKVDGKTLNLNDKGRSEIVRIPEKASYWLFKEVLYQGKVGIAGPLPLSKNKLKELTEDKEKSPEN